MDMLKEDLDREFNRIKEKLDKGIPMDQEELKMILLSGLFEEDLHESKQ